MVSLAGAPELLRPGVIPLPEIEALIGPVNRGATPDGPHPAPGMHPRHYRPTTPLYLLTRDATPPAGNGAWLSVGEDPRACAATLYQKLHELDSQGLDWIAVEPPPDTPEWAGVRDRLRRAESVQPRR